MRRRTTTSETGKLRRSAAGFTMVEVMVVIAILSLLVSFVLYATVGHRKTARIEATKALIQRIEIALQAYHQVTNSYPPDGIDSEVVNDDGVAIRGSACLHHFLSREFEVVKDVAGEERRSKHDPLMSFRGKELEEDPDNPGVFEIIDEFGFPLHYDNTENRQFEPQDGSVHMPVAKDHPPDPREDVAYGSVERDGIQGKGYDIWSHGEYGHKIDVPAETAVALTIGSWNLNVKASEGPASESK